MKIKRLAAEHPDWLEWAPGASSKDDKIVLVRRPDTVDFHPSDPAPHQNQLSQPAHPPGLASAPGRTPTPESWEMLSDARRGGEGEGLSAQAHHRTVDIVQGEGGLGAKMNQDQQYDFVTAAVRPRPVATLASPNNARLQLPAPTLAQERRQLEPVGSGASRGSGMRFDTGAPRDHGSNPLAFGGAAAPHLSGGSLPLTMPLSAHSVTPHAYPHPSPSPQQPAQIHRLPVTRCLLQLSSGHQLVTADAAKATPFLGLSSQQGGVSIRLCTFGLLCSYTPMATLGAMEIHLVAAGMQNGSRVPDRAAVALQPGAEAGFEAKLWVWPPVNHAGVRVITSSADSATLFCPSLI